ncbi:MAG: hypothetical protein ACREMX_05900, partial [Gemmatimonadales bacterium]
MRRSVLLLLLAVLPGSAAAQSSQFGVRGLGFPGRPLSVHALGSAGAFGMFDPESSLNSAAIGAFTAVTAVFTGVQDFRSVENPAGSESVREARFPQVAFAGPIRRLPMVFGLSYSNYMSRDFSLATADTIDLRGVPVPVSDTLSSRGGINDLRFAASYRLGDRWVFGGGIHVLTGSNRLESRRTFSDDSYRPTRQSSEVSYAGAGASLGVIRQFGPSLAIALLARTDGHVNIERDSTRVSRTDLPHSFGLGLRWRPAPRLDLGSQVVYRTWSSANSDVLAAGGPGAENTFEVAFGGEYVSDPRRPYRRPIRFGARYATVPFLLTPGVQPTEFTVSLGTGTRFAQQ